MVQVIDNNKYSIDDFTITSNTLTSLRDTELKEMMFDENANYTDWNIISATLDLLIRVDKLEKRLELLESINKSNSL